MRVVGKRASRTWTLASLRGMQAVFYGVAAAAAIGLITCALLHHA
jgi:hypothetical protein